MKTSTLRMAMVALPICMLLTAASALAATGQQMGGRITDTEIVRTLRRAINGDTRTKEKSRGIKITSYRGVVTLSGEGDDDIKCLVGQFAIGIPGVKKVLSSIGGGIVEILCCCGKIPGPGGTCVKPPGGGGQTPP